MISSERASQNGQSDASFNFTVPSSEELCVCVKYKCHTKTDGTECDKQVYHCKGHKNRSRVAQISAP